MVKPVAQRVYNFYGRFYDGFDMLFKKRLSRAIDSLALQPRERVLDIGIGTGLSLAFYPAEARVVGVDLSAGMLAQAARKLREGTVRPGRARWRTHLLQANALNLPFAAGSFDAVFMSHVVATVPDPYRAMREAIRVCRENARIVLVNHFQSPWPVINWVEAAIDPLCRRLGWRSDLSLRELLEPLGVRDIHPTGGGLFQIVHLMKRGEELRMTDLRRAAAARPALEAGP